jgi:hypothetical protein
LGETFRCWDSPKELGAFCSKHSAQTHLNMRHIFTSFCQNNYIIFRQISTAKGFYFVGPNFWRLFDSIWPFFGAESIRSHCEREMEDRGRRSVCASVLERFRCRAVASSRPPTRYRRMWRKWSPLKRSWRRVCPELTLVWVARLVRWLSLFWRHRLVD